MALNKQRLIFIGCIVLTISLSSSLYKPLRAAIYRWKEPYFIMPLYLKDNTLALRNDRWGEGHFGAKRKNGRGHKGIDIRADIGTVVYAAKSGMAAYYYEPEGMGRYIKIIHPDGRLTIYGHLEAWLIKQNSWVAQGQVIGLVGKSGNANIHQIQPHLHFEIRDAKGPLDPFDGYLNLKK